ncbi:MAG TPA: hypothetical protein VIH57_06880 [Bacteroidales bacterium]
MSLSISEIKNDLHKLIVETDDIEVLNRVQAYFCTLKSKQVDWWDSLSEKEIASIERGAQQLDNNQRIPHAEVKEKVNRLLGRK